MPNKFEVGKTYRGDEAAVGECIFSSEKGAVLKWADGSEGYWLHSYYERFTEIKPKITKKYWLVHYNDGTLLSSQSNPKEWLGAFGKLAITEHTVTFEEGEGLK